MCVDTKIRLETKKLCCAHDEAVHKYTSLYPC